MVSAVFHSPLGGASNPSGAPLVVKANCKPRDLPIQFACISRTLSGQFVNPSNAPSNSPE